MSTAFNLSPNTVAIASLVLYTKASCHIIESESIHRVLGVSSSIEEWGQLEADVHLHDHLIGLLDQGMYPEGVYQIMGMYWLHGGRDSWTGEYWTDIKVHSDRAIRRISIDEITTEDFGINLIEEPYRDVLFPNEKIINKLVA